LQDNPDGGAAALEFSGSATIRQAAEAHARLVNALGGEGPLALDLAAVTSADLSFVQLVESARASFAAVGRELSLSAPADGALLDVLTRGGFLAGDDMARRQFWIQNGAA
jgi:hypothetical protein